MVDNWRLNSIFQIDKKKYDEGYDRVFGKKDEKPPKNKKRIKKIAPNSIVERL